MSLKHILSALLLVAGAGVFAAGSVKSASALSKEIAAYMERVNVLDKAGAYAIQEYPELLGASWEGEVENIIGLPLLKLQEVLESAGAL